MSSRGRSSSPRPLGNRDVDVDMDRDSPPVEKPHARVVIVTNLTRNVVEAHLRSIFGFYGDITKIDLPLFMKSGQNKGKAALEFSTSTAAHKAASYMDGGQLDGAVLKVELSDLPIRSRSRSRPRYARNGRDALSRSRSYSRSRSRSRRPPYGRTRPMYDRGPRYGDTYRSGGFGGGRRVPPPRDTYRPHSRSRTRSRSPLRRPPGRLAPRRRSPSYERGGYGRGRSRSRTYSVHSSRSRSRSFYTPSRSRTRSRSRSRSYSSYSRYSRSRSRSMSKSISRAPRSRSRGRRSHSRDDIRDSRSRSPMSVRD